MLWYLGCTDWHGATFSDWGGGNNGFVRGRGGVFSFDGAYGAWRTDDLYGRGVAVVGTGL